MEIVSIKILAFCTRMWCNVLVSLEESSIGSTGKSAEEICQTYKTGSWHGHEEVLELEWESLLTRGRKATRFAVFDPHSGHRRWMVVH